jgi:hypothetical protein
VFGHRQAHAVDVHFLEGVGADHGAGHLAGDADERHGVQPGVGQGGQGVGGAGARGGQEDLGQPGDAGHALGDEAGTLLVARKHVADDGASGQGVVQRQVRAAGDAGKGSDALPFQKPDDDFGSARTFHGTSLLGLPGCGRAEAAGAGPPRRKTPADLRRRGLQCNFMKKRTLQRNGVATTYDDQRYDDQRLGGEEQ